MYQIYTFPNCEKCHKAIDIMKARKIEYEEISASTSDGRNKMREFTKQYNDKLEREKKGEISWVKMPIIISSDNGETKIFQGEEGLAKILEGK